MTPHPAAELARVMQAENAFLEAGDIEAAMLLLPEKRRAAEALAAQDPASVPDPATVAALRSVMAENDRRLTLAIQVQGRVLATVARLARDAAPEAARYGAAGRATPSRSPMALTVRA